MRASFQLSGGMMSILPFGRRSQYTIRCQKFSFIIACLILFFPARAQVETKHDEGFLRGRTQEIEYAQPENEKHGSSLIDNGIRTTTTESKREWRKESIEQSLPRSYRVLLDAMTDENGTWRPRRSSQQLQRSIESTSSLLSSEGNVTINKNPSNIDETRTIKISKEMAKISAWVLSVFLSVSVLATILSVITCGLIYKYRGHRRVAIGQPPFLYLICFACILLSSQVYFVALADHSNNAGTNHGESIADACCVAQLWFANLGEIILHQAIFCKLWRSYKVTRFRKRIEVLPKHVIGPFIFFLIAVVALTIAQTIIFPPYWYTETIQFDDSDVNDGSEIRSEEHGYCIGMGEYSGDEDAFTAPVYTDTYYGISLAMQACQNLSLLIVLIMACFVRKVPEEISDSRSVCHALCTSCCINILLTIVFIAALLFSRVGIATIAVYIGPSLFSFTFLGYLVIPKLFNVCRDERKRRHQCDIRNAPAVYADNAENQIGRGTVRVTGLDIPNGTLLDRKWTETTQTSTLVQESSICENPRDESEENKNQPLNSKRITLPDVLESSQKSNDNQENKIHQ